MSPSGDADLVGELYRAAPVARSRLTEALRAFRHSAQQGPLYVWATTVGPQRPHATPVVRSLAYPDYRPEVDELIDALRAVRAVPILDWTPWLSAARQWTAQHVANAELAEILRVLAAIICGERLCAGLIRGAIDRGTITAAAQRIDDALRQH